MIANADSVADAAADVALPAAPVVPVPLDVPVCEEEAAEVPLGASVIDMVAVPVLVPEAVAVAVAAVEAQVAAVGRVVTP